MNYMKHEILNIIIFFVYFFVIIFSIRIKYVFDFNLLEFEVANEECAGISGAGPRSRCALRPLALALFG